MEEEQELMQPGFSMDPDAIVGPLQGVRVLDLTSVIVGPFATQLLADMGADVTKVEPPEGDVMRHVPPMRSNGMGHLFLHMNRNKRSIMLDLKTDAGKQALFRLIEPSDVLTCNMRPQALKALGLDYDAVSKANPKIIYATVAGYGQTGPKAHQPAYDDLIQGAVAVPSLAAAGGSELRYAPLTLADRTVALNFAMAICACLVHRERTGRGQQLTIPMFESMAQFVLSDHMGGATFDPPIGATTYTRLLSKNRRPYRTRDGYVCALIYNDKQWRSFCRVTGQTLLLDDRRFSDQQSRAENIDVFYGIISDILATRSTREWLELFDSADIPAGELHTPASLIEDAHLQATNFFETFEHPTEGRLRMMRPPMDWSGGALRIRRLPPTLGADGNLVLREAGYTHEQIAEMVEAGATRC